MTDQPITKQVLMETLRQHTDEIVLPEVGQIVEDKNAAIYG
jgi:hypothetical protein